MEGSIDLSHNGPIENVPATFKKFSTFTKMSHGYRRLDLIFLMAAAH
jgi:hypothetical protein